MLKACYKTYFYVPCNNGTTLILTNITLYTIIYNIMVIQIVNVTIDLDLQ